MSLQDKIEKPFDPNAPVVLDLGRCQKLIRTAPNHLRLPNGDIIQDFAGQLKCALEEMQGSSTKIVQAQNDTIRYQRESENANAEVKTMQALLVKAREERDAAL